MWCSRPTEAATVNSAAALLPAVFFSPELTTFKVPAYLIAAVSELNFLALTPNTPQLEEPTLDKEKIPPPVMLGVIVASIIQVPATGLAKVPASVLICALATPTVKIATADKIIFFMFKFCLKLMRQI